MPTPNLYLNGEAADANHGMPWIQIFLAHRHVLKFGSFGNRLLPQQHQETLDLVVDLRSVADDQRRWHGPRDDPADGARVA
jgi:hypothetical protein